jgi:hypothetical protein
MDALEFGELLTKSRRTKGEIESDQVAAIRAIRDEYRSRWVRNSVGKFDTKSARFRAIVRRNRAEFLRKEFGDIVGIIYQYGTGFAVEFGLDEADVIARIWERLAREFTTNSLEWKTRYFTDSSYRAGIIRNIARKARDDSWRSSRRNMRELKAWNSLVDTLDNDRVLPIESSGASPDNSTQYVDGNPVNIRSIKAAQRVEVMFTQAPTMTDNIDETGTHKTAGLFAYERRLFRYFGPNRTDQTRVVLALLESVLCATYNGNVRWEKYGIGDKGTRSNVRDLLEIPVSIPRDMVRNEATKWAKIALDRAPRSRRIIDNQPEFWHRDYARVEPIIRPEFKEFGRAVTWSLDGIKFPTIGEELAVTYDHKSDDWAELIAWELGNREHDLYSVEEYLEVKASLLLAMNILNHPGLNLTIDHKSMYRDYRDSGKAYRANSVVIPENIRQDIIKSRAEFDKRLEEYTTR